MPPVPRKKNNAAKNAQPPLKAVDPSGKSSSKLSFFELVYGVVEQIPKGRVTSYGAIARYLGTGLSARMVGWALNSPVPASRKLPAQRVVNRNGQLSGKAHFKTPTRMQELLEKDGLIVENDTVIDFKNAFWDPAIEL